LRSNSSGSRLRASGGTHLLRSRLGVAIGGYEYGGGPPKRALAIPCTTIAALAKEAAIRPQVPVVIQADEYDACGNDVVHGLNPKGDGFLAVKAGPGLHYKRIDKLFNGEEVPPLRLQGRLVRNRLHQGWSTLQRLGAMAEDIAVHRSMPLWMGSQTMD
jgi:hypothetical protein